MAPHPLQGKKVDISAMTEEEKKLFQLYGKFPPKKNVAKHNLMERKYFDSGDYALSKAGKTAPQSVGTTIPSPENIHHTTHSTIPTPTVPLPPVSSANGEVNVANMGVLPTHEVTEPILQSIDNAIVSEVKNKEAAESNLQSIDHASSTEGCQNGQPIGRIPELYQPTDLQPQ